MVSPTFRFQGQYERYNAQVTFQEIMDKCKINDHDVSRITIMQFRRRESRMTDKVETFVLAAQLTSRNVMRTVLEPWGHPLAVTMTLLNSVPE